jgi:hypothetical protein
LKLVPAPIYGKSPRVASLYKSRQRFGKALHKFRNSFSRDYISAGIGTTLSRNADKIVFWKNHAIIGGSQKAYVIAISPLKELAKSVLVGSNVVRETKIVFQYQYIVQALLLGKSHYS